MWLVNIRITGTGMAYRTGLNEHVWRDPSLYLNDNFLQRINGLPVIRDHPENSLLNDREFKDRIVGTVMLPYIKDDEVWAIARIYNDEIINEIKDETVSTSPAVSFNGTSDNILIDDKDSHLLIEGRPALIDHIALVTKEQGSLGVWDKNQIPEGIEVSNKEGMEMDEEKLQKMLNTLANSVGSKLDAFKSGFENRLDSMESQMSNFNIRLDAVKKDNHIEGDKTKHNEILKKLNELEERKDSGDENNLEKKVAELERRLDTKEEEGKKGRKDRRDRKDEDDYDKKEREEGREEEKEEENRKRNDRKDESKERETGRDEEKEEEKHKRKDRKDEAEDRFSWTAEDEEEERKDKSMIDARVKADSAFSACGKKAPKPFDGESAIAYRKRALSALQKFSPDYKDAKIKDISDPAMLSMAEKIIYADAAQAIKLQRQNTPGRLFEIIRTDAANRQIKTFEGDPNAWLAAFKLSPRTVVKFNPNGRVA